VAGGKWVVSHGPAYGGLLLRRSCGPLEHRPGMPEGRRPGGVEIVSVCGSLAWQA
jgi:hypothetical protein